MATLTEYAVRIKGTQMYLPRPQRRDGRGGSHLEPVDFNLPAGQRGFPNRYETNMQIRSFATKKAAQNLLSAWLKGKFGCHRGSGCDYDDWYEEIYQIKGSSREHMRDQMEIVTILIELPA